MNAPAIRAATYDDLLQVPENLVAEIIHGQLITHPRPAPRHAWASSSLGGELVSPRDKGRGGPGGWWILDEPELHLGPHVLVPTLAGWRRERLPTLPEAAWFELTPDWICEVLSPSTARTVSSGAIPPGPSAFATIGHGSLAAALPCHAPCRWRLANSRRKQGSAITSLPTCCPRRRCANTSSATSSCRIRISTCCAPSVANAPAPYRSCPWTGGRQPSGSTVH
jgi:hypothetical protein